MKLAPHEKKFLRLAYEEAQRSYEQGGIPIGAALADGEQLIAVGHNRRVQNGDPTAHGEIDCLRNAGRRRSYKGLTLYTTLSPCMMCSGAAMQFGISRVVVGEVESFQGEGVEFLRAHGVEVAIADDQDCIALLRAFIEEHPEVWNEDIGA